MMITKSASGSWSQLARVCRCFAWAGKSSDPKHETKNDYQSKNKDPTILIGSESNPKKVNFMTPKHNAQIKRREKHFQHWSEKETGTDDLEEDISDFVISLDEDQLKAYGKIYDLSAQDLQYLKIVIEEVGASKFNAQNIKEILLIFEKMTDLKHIPTDHIMRIAKWAGTSIARKLNFYFTRNTFMRFYYELVNRKALPLVVGNVESLLNMDFINVDFDPIESDVSCDKLLEEYPKLLKVLSKKFSELFYDESRGKRVLNPNKFYQFMDMIVCMSNLNIYRFEAFQTAKLLLWYGIEHMPTKQDIHSCIAVKATNFYWAFIRVRVPDTQFTSKLLLFYTHKYLHRNNRRKFNLLHCLTLEMALMKEHFKMSPETIAPVVEGIKVLLQHLRAEVYDPNSRTIFNAKNSIMYVQIMLNLFPELGPLFRGHKELIDYEPLPDNPFREFFYDMTDNLLTYLWVSQAALSCKKGRGHPHLLVFQAGDGIFHIAREGNYRQLLLYQNKIADQLKTVPGVHKLASDMVFGVYEADIVINDDYVVEVDSLLHFVYCQRKLPVISHFLKQYHLRLMGFKNVMSIGWHDKILQERVYNHHAEFFNEIVAQLLSGKKR